MKPRQRRRDFWSRKIGKCRQKKQESKLAFTFFWDEPRSGAQECGASVRAGAVASQRGELKHPATGSVFLKKDRKKERKKSPVCSGMGTRQFSVRGRGGRTARCRSSVRCVAMPARFFLPPRGETSSSSSRDGWMSAGVVLTSPAAERY